MDVLERTYEEKKKKYDKLIATRARDNSTRDQIRTLNTELSALLQDMLTQVSTMKGSAAKLDMYRNQLIKKLVGVQNDYTLLQTKKDEYVGLQKLQNHQQELFDSTFFWYGIVFAIVCVIFFFTLIRKGQSAPTMPTMTTRATTMPAFM